MPILPGVMPIIGETDAQAKEQLDKLQGWLTASNALTLVSQRLGYDIAGYPLDGPVPDFPQKTEGGQAFSQTLLEMARREKMTLRDLYNITAAARGHWVIYGTPKRIADILAPTASSSCRLTSRAPSTTSSTRWCRSYSDAASTARNIPGRPCATTSGLPGRRLARRT
jgi:hypothetical protein